MTTEHVAAGELASPTPRMPLHLIEPDPDNVRVTPASASDDAELLSSIRALGVLQPVLLRPLPPTYEPEGEVAIPARYRIIAGHRRFKAAQEAGLDAIPYLLFDRPDATPEDLERLVVLAQTSENVTRAGMTPLDIWAAVDKAIAAGNEPPAVALALGITEGQVAQFRAMGSMHPEIVAYIRETGNLPPASSLKVICQASHETQVAAFRGAKGKGNLYWPHVAERCMVQRIPMERAKFEKDKYPQDKLWMDLFPEPGTDGVYAEDVALFLKLQNAWLDEEIERKKRAGFGEARRMVRDKSGGHEVPKGCRSWDWERIESAPKKKSERAGYLYVADVRPDGSVHEMVWKLPQQKPNAPQARGGTNAAPQREAKDDAPIFTKDGIARLEEVKREALKEALSGPGPLARDLDVLVTVLAVLLHERCGSARYALGGMGSAADMRWLKRGGRLRDDLTLDEIVAYARGVASEAVARGTAISLPIVEMVGDYVRAPVAYPATDKDLGMVKRPGLFAIRDALGWKASDHKTQATLRGAIAKHLDAITPAHLPVVGWQPPAPYPGEDKGEEDAA